MPANPLAKRGLPSVCLFGVFADVQTHHFFIVINSNANRELDSIQNAARQHERPCPRGPDADELIPYLSCPRDVCELGQASKSHAYEQSGRQRSPGPADPVDAPDGEGVTSRVAAP